MDAYILSYHKHFTCSQSSQKTTFWRSFLKPSSNQTPSGPPCGQEMASLVNQAKQRTQSRSSWHNAAQTGADQTWGRVDSGMVARTPLRVKQRRAQGVQLQQGSNCSNCQGARRRPAGGKTQQNPTAGVLGAESERAPHRAP